MMEVMEDEAEAKQKKKKPLNKLFYHGTKHRLPLLDDEVHFVMEFSNFFCVVIVVAVVEIFCGISNFRMLIDQM